MPIVRNIGFVVVAVVAGLTAISALGMEIGSLTASAGIVREDPQVRAERHRADHRTGHGAVRQRSHPDPPEDDDEARRAVRRPRGALALIKKAFDERGLRFALQIASWQGITLSGILGYKVLYVDCAQGDGCFDRLQHGPE